MYKIIISLVFLSFSVFAQNERSNNELVCKNNYNPVCGVDGNTYANKCFAEVALLDIEHEGVCFDPTMQCTSDFDPVCGMDNKTYDNACIATVQGIEIIESGVCGGADGCENKLAFILTKGQESSCHS